MENIDFELLPIYFNNFKKYIDKIINEDLKEYDINTMHFRPIVLLYKFKEGLSLNELTLKIGIDKANVTRVINDLIKKEIVFKSEEKQRGYKIKLTDKGIIIAQNIFEHKKKTSERVFMGFTNEEKKEFTYLMFKLFSQIPNIEEEKYEENI